MAWTKVCQYPVTGEVHFYFLIKFIKHTYCFRCQYPVTGEVHFYETPGEIRTVRMTVSIPCNG